jgi:hypothetical protein
MAQPLKLEDILAELSEDSEAWVLQDQESKTYLIIPDPRYPGRKPIRFFLRREDAQDILMEVNESNPNLRNKYIIPIKVKLKEALRGIASDSNHDHADAFVVHGSAEVYEYVRARE